jgi:hypothetical protein
VPLVDAVQAAREMPLADKAGAPEGNQNAVKIETGDKNNVDNINIDFKPQSINPRPTGTSKEYLLRRLARDHPQALDRIQSGELTTRKAAIEYGIVKVKTPMQIIMVEVGKLNKSQWIELQVYLNNLISGSEVT